MVRVAGSNNTIQIDCIYLHYYYTKSRKKLSMMLLSDHLAPGFRNLVLWPTDIGIGRQCSIEIVQLLSDVQQGASCTVSENGKCLLASIIFPNLLPFCHVKAMCGILVRYAVPFHEDLDFMVKAENLALCQHLSRMSIRF